MKNKKKYILIFAISLILFVFSCIFNKFDFNFSTVTSNIKFLYLYLRFTFFLILFLIVLLLYNFIIKLIRGNAEAISFLKYFIITFITIMLFALIMWPGAWVWDEFWAIDDASKVVFSTWQGYLTIMFYSYCLMLCYKAQTIILVQIVIISSIISYILNNVSVLVKKDNLKYLFFVPLVLPAVIINNIYPLRLTLYAYIELYLLFKTYLIYKNKIEVSKYVLFELSFSTFILTIWRSEGIIYILYYLFLLIFIIKKKDLKLFFLVCIVTCYVLYAPIYIYQKKYDTRSKIYNVTTIINPLSVMMQEDLKNSTNELKLINNVININKVKKWPSYVEIPSFWNEELMQQNYDKHYNDLYKGYGLLIIKNSDKFFNARIKTFMATNGFDKYTSMNNNTLHSTKDESNKWYLELKNGAINLKLRNKILKFLNNPSRKWRMVFWNCIPFVLFDLFLLIKLLISKKWLELMMLLFVLIRVILIFLTAPANYFMYYFPTYLVSIYIFIYYFIKKKEGIKK